MKKIWQWIKNHKKLILIILLGCGALYWFTKDDGNVQKDYIKGQAFIGDISKTISVTGEVLPKSLLSVNPETEGKIKKLYVQMGDFVEKDQLILELDSKTQQNEFNNVQSQFNLLKKQKKVRELHFNLASKKLRQTKELFKRKGVSKQVLEQAEENFANAKLALEETQASILQNANKLDTAKKHLDNTFVKAPQAGYVVSLPVNIGQFVRSSTLLAQITNLDEMQIRMKISENDIAQIKVGMPLQYHLFHNNQKQYKAVIDEIDPAHTLLSQGNYEQGMDMGSRAIYFYAKTFVDNKDRHLRLGMTTQTTLFLEEKKDLLLVPLIAVHMEDKPYVEVLDEQNNIKRVFVTLGSSDHKNIEVLKGLSKGQEVVISLAEKGAYEHLNRKRGFKDE